MVLRSLIRPVLVALAGSTVAACGAVEADPERFENLARMVSDVPVSLERPGTTSTSGATALRKPQPVRVEVLDPHDLWDARDGLAPAVVKAAAPLVAEAAVGEVRRQAAELRPAVLPTRQGGTRLIQLGAFSSREAAETAWSKLRGERVLSGLTPRFEPVTVGDRALVRLKVAAPADAAASICAAAGVDGPWCRRGA
ncbi:MAG: SPOR domain-containing protein [Caulobacteraceae bacterium]|nr:SPOR domain-containing protein [Caulobacteraceae bacterium]